MELITLDQSVMEQDDTDDPNRVTLITMHNTKGLEFDRVIVTGMEEGLFPRDSEGDLEEERRLFYVSITRARSELYFTSCRNRMIFGRTMYQPPSRFLRELPEESILVDGETGPIPDFPDSGIKPGTGIYHEDYGMGVINRVKNSGGHTVIRAVFESGRSGVFIYEFSRNKIELFGKDYAD
jgi:DNA helicase-2/ATP-dependent DNA helicase PcrA